MGKSFIQAMQTSNIKTTNGMSAHTDTNNPLFSLFVAAGATLRINQHRFKKEIEHFGLLFDNPLTTDNRTTSTKVLEAWKNDKLSTLKILFYARDIVEGAGERKFFRTNIDYLLSKTDGLDLIITNLLKEENILNEIVRVDDLIYFANKLIGDTLTRNLHVDMIITFLFKMLNKKEVGSIVAKWMPRKKSQYSRLVRYMRANGHIATFSTYRKLIASKTSVVEQKMSLNEWDNIDLEKVPSIALNMYKSCFEKHNILQPYLENLKKGKAKINAKRLTPDAIVMDILEGKYKEMPELAEAQWQNLKELNDLPSEYRIIPVIDVSGSMYYPNLKPISIAIGLGLFIAGRNPNHNFSDAFITFSSEPKFDYIKGYDIISEVKDIALASWGGSTNIEATFKLILNKAIKYNVAKDEMPTHIIIFSDMQFDQCTEEPDDTSYEMIYRKYNKAGYDTPVIIFWNINNEDSVPIQYDESGALLVSGSSQNALNLVLKKYYERPIDLMTEAISSTRYDHITL